MKPHTTVSTCTAKTEQGEHVFEIFDYSQHRGIGDMKFIRSGTFSIGGHDWSIRFYPDGNLGFNSNGNQDFKDYISVYLELLGEGAMARASCDLRLVDQSTGLSTSLNYTDPRMFNSSDKTRFAPQSGLFMRLRDLEDSAYLRDDHLTIKCVVTVMKEPHVSETELFSAIEVPPSDILETLGKLIDSEMGSDVTFSVGGETFTAHKLVLAMRSPVFKAEFYGPMRESTVQDVTIEDMQPAVFRALLHFIYTDSLPGTDDLDKDAKREMIWHLLVAADRYAVDRLKMVCQSILSKDLDVETVSATMALAYQHNCDRLRDTCLEFITSPNVVDAVVATEGYKNLKITCPSALVDAFEKSKRLCKA